MSRNDGDDRLRPLPVEGYPDPVLQYSVSDGEPVVGCLNGAFRSALGDLAAGTPVAEGLDRIGIVPIGTVEDVASHILAGERFGVRVNRESDPSRYLATAVPGPDGEGGHVVFATSETPERCDLGLDRMASVVSHDLRNPLEVAKTRLRVARETGEDEHLDHVARAHDRMERIIEDVLTLARGEDVIDPSRSVDLTEIARTAWESVDTDGATLSVEDPLPTAVADPDRTGRVFENLFRNAVEHGSTVDAAEGDATGYAEGDGATDAGRDGGRPEIRVGPIEGESDGFYVADDGPGIPATDREAVFEPGYSTHEHGTGLGLAIVDRIATAHGWTVGITASREGGTRVEVHDL